MVKKRNPDLTDVRNLKGKSVIFYVSVRVSSVDPLLAEEMQKEIPSEQRLCQICAEPIWVAKRSLEAGIARDDDNDMVFACNQCAQKAVEVHGKPNHVTASVDGEIISLEEGKEISQEVKDKILGQNRRVEERVRSRRGK